MNYILIAILINFIISCGDESISDNPRTSPQSPTITTNQPTTSPKDRVIDDKSSNLPDKSVESKKVSRHSRFEQVLLDIAIFE